MDLISDEFLMISVAQKLSRFDHRSVELSRSFLLPSKAPCSRPLVGSSQHYKGLQNSMPLKPAKHTFMWFTASQHHLNSNHWKHWKHWWQHKCCISGLSAAVRMADITLLAEAASCLSDAVQAPALDLEEHNEIAWNHMKSSLFIFVCKLWIKLWVKLWRGSVDPYTAHTGCVAIRWIDKIPAVTLSSSCSPVLCCPGYVLKLSKCRILWTNSRKLWSWSIGPMKSLGQRSPEDSRP